MNKTSIFNPNQIIIINFDEISMKCFNEFVSYLNYTSTEPIISRREYNSHGYKCRNRSNPIEL